MAIAGQTMELAPADGKLYAMRDVTATVDSMGLIASSVLVPKNAAGAKKSSFLMSNTVQALYQNKRRSAETLNAYERSCKKTRPKPDLCHNINGRASGLAIGNSLEIQEAIETLLGEGPKDTTELIFTLEPRP